MNPVVSWVETREATDVIPDLESQYVCHRNCMTWHEDLVMHFQEFTASSARDVQELRGFSSKLEHACI